MLYDFVIWAGPAGVLSSPGIAASCLHRSVWHGRSRSAAHRAAPAPPAVHQRRVTTLPAACRTGPTGAAPAPADSSALGIASHRTSIGAGPSSASAGEHGPARPKGSGEPVPTIETQGTPSVAGAAVAVAMFVVVAVDPLCARAIVTTPNERHTCVGKNNHHMHASNRMFMHRLDLT